MAPALNALLEFLRIIRIARHYLKRFPGRGASILAFIGRKLNLWWRFWLGKFGRPKPIERQFLGTEASSYSVSGGSGVVREYVVAASYAPPSASRASLHELTDRPTAAVAQTVGVHPPPVPDTLSVDHPYVPNPPGGPSHFSHILSGRTLGNRSSGNLSAASIQSRASDRYSIITNSRESMRATHGQPSRYPRAPHRQFGRGPDPARSRERPSRPSTPITHSHTPTRSHTPTHPTHPTHPRLEIITSPPSTHDDGKVGPIVQPSGSASPSYTHEPLSPPPMSEVRRRQSSTIIVDIQNPSTDSLAMSPPAYPPQITDEPFTLDSSTVHSSPDTPAVDLHDEPSLGSPTSSNHPAFDYFLPEGRIVQLINADQIPRYTKNATMQVGPTILSLHIYTSLQTPRGDSL